MKEKDPNKIFATYSAILNQQQFIAGELDYSILDKHKPFLRQLAAIGNSGISVFDLCKKEHVFYSPDFSTLLGYDLKQIEDEGQGFLDAKIHPAYLEIIHYGHAIPHFA